MGPIDWAAIIGAAAWVPQVGSWVARRFVRPALRLVPSNAPEIGYTGFGPVFNLTCAISAEKKDAIIERMTVTLEHERGQKMSLAWVILNEPTFEWKAPEVWAGKGQLAIALKVGTLLLVEKTIAFNDPAFQEVVREKTNAVNDRLSFLRRKQQGDAEHEVLKSKEFDDLVALFERFPWQEGRYTAHVEMRISGMDRPATQQLTFTLAASDVEKLQKNLPEIRRVAQETFAPPAKPAPQNWGWVYPPFRR